MRAVSASVVAFVVAFAMALAVALARPVLVPLVAPLLAALDAGHHVLVVPAVLDEVDRHAAGPVTLAMFAPVLAVARRNPQIDRLRRDRHHPRPRDDHRLRRHEHRLRETA